eukprot:1140635-Pelagomonas_calceolata.AAC.3
MPASSPRPLRASGSWVAHGEGIRMLCCAGFGHPKPRIAWQSRQAAPNDCHGAGASSSVQCTARFLPSNFIKW